MTTNNKHLITSKIEYIRQLLFSYAIFFIKKLASVLFSVLASHANTNLPNRRFQHKQFLISKYLSILHALLQSRSHLLGFHI